MILKIGDIVDNEYLLSAFSFVNSAIEEKIHKMQDKYPNLMSSFQNHDGYAFPSGVFMEERSGNRIPLIQINNVNELEYNLNSIQKFVYLPIGYRKEKSKYELKDKSVLVSLTGDANFFKDQWMGNGGVQKNTGKREKENLYLPHVQEEVIHNAFGNPVFVEESYELTLDVFMKGIEQYEK